LRVIKNAIRNINNNNSPATFYIHSWELVPEFMPKIALSFLENFVTYYNLGNTLKRLDRIIKKFKFTSFSRFMSQSTV
jgi:hypothetical protein